MQSSIDIMLALKLKFAVLIDSECTSLPSWIHYITQYNDAFRKNTDTVPSACLPMWSGAELYPVVVLSDENEKKKLISSNGFDPDNVGMVLDVEKRWRMLRGDGKGCDEIVVIVRPDGHIAWRGEFSRLK